MTRVVATTPGLYPLPDWAKDELAALKGRQKEDLITGDEGEELATVYEQAREDVVERQRTAGLDRVVEGQLRWDDMLTHPLAVSDVVETRGIVRYYDNNNFYREPVVTGELSATGDVAAELDTVDAASDHLQGVFPDPYSLADLATDEHYGDEAAFLGAITDFLADELRACPPMETVFLLAPSLVTEPPGEAGERVSEAVDTVASAADAEVVLYPYWGALSEKAHAHVLDADIDALGYDLVTEPDDNLYNVQEYGTTDDVALGLVDGQNTLVESPETVRERIEWFEERTPNEDFGRVYATANTGLFHLPVNKFEAKLDALAAAGMEVTA